MIRFSIVRRIYAFAGTSRVYNNSHRCGYQGVHAVLSTVEGLKKFVSIKESPYHGLNFCIGTVSEMLMDPGKELCDVIRYFGTRKKIFKVHFRNILGNRLEFSEVAIDEGSFNAAKAVATFKEVGYEYMVQHDHTRE